MPDATLPGRRIEWGRGEPGHAGQRGVVTVRGPVPDPAALATAVGVAALRHAGDGRARVGVGDRWHDLAVEAHPTVADVAAALAGPGDPGPPPPVGLDGDFPVALARSPEGVRCTYDPAMVDAGAAERFARCVLRLAGLAPTAVVSEVDVLDGAAAAAVLAAGRTPAAGGRVGTVPALFAEVAARRAGAPAVSDAERTWTYAELDARSDRLAAGLAARGVGAGDLVGVCLDRDADLVATLLAVLKAGAAYVPMDVRYPVERLRRTTAGAGPVLVVTTVADFPDGAPTVRPNLLAAEGPAPALPTDPGAPAYVIHTSGSTGRPKGVVVAHRNVAALVAATAGPLGLGTADVWSMFHSPAFDVSVFEMWGCLLTGGHLVVAPYWVTRSPEEFHALLAERRVTVLSQTPSAFVPVRDAHLRAPRELAVRLVIMAGEPLDVRVLESWFRARPPSACRVVNMFGITETTVHSTLRTVTAADVAAGSRSVGTALPGWTLSVRDPRGRPQPFGVAGEIHVGGAGVAEGYLGQPELTAQRFRTEGGERVYRSGDLGRLWPDGSLDHLGRMDDQVKLRGFRIEPGEIRAALLACRQVRAAAIRLHRGDGDAGDARLDAYVVLHPGGTVAAVRARLREVLPEHMVPATVTAVESLPLTVNGKVDVARLPAPAVLSGADAAPGPADPVSAVLSAWRATLHPGMGPDDDFFDHGGNSLLAVRLSAAMRRAELPPVTLRELYQHPTAARLAEHLAARPA